MSTRDEDANSADIDERSENQLTIVPEHQTIITMFLVVIQFEESHCDFIVVNNKHTCCWAPIARSARHAILAACGGALIRRGRHVTGFYKSRRVAPVCSVEIESVLRTDLT